MVSCLAAAAYIFKVDVMVENDVINDETGESESHWVIDDTVNAYVFPYLDGGIRGAGTNERFTEYYWNDEFLRIKTSKELSKRWRITNIRNKKTGKVIYQEQITGAPTVYNVSGSAPVVNPVTGGIDEWLSTMERAQVQA